MSERRWPAFENATFEQPRFSDTSLLTCSPLSPPATQGDVKQSNWADITQDLVEQNRLLEDECRLLEDQFKKLAARANSMEGDDPEHDQTRSRGDNGTCLTDLVASIIQQQSDQLDENFLSIHVEEAHEHLDHVLANFDEATAVATAARGHVGNLEARCEQLRVEAEVACQQRDIEMKVGACLRDELRECKDLANAGRSVRLASQQEEDEQVHETSMKRMSKATQPSVAFGSGLSLADELDGITPMAVPGPEVAGETSDREAEELRLTLRALQAELSHTRFEHETALRAASAAKAEEVAAKAEATASRSELGEIATLKMQLREKQKSAATAEEVAAKTEATASRSELDEIATLKMQLKEKQNSAAKAEDFATKAEATASRSELSEIATLQMQLREKQEESTELHQQQEHHIKDREKASAASTKLQEQHSKLCADADVLRREFGESQRELVELRASTNHAREKESAEHRQLQESYRKASADVDALRLKLNEAQHELAQLRVSSTQHTEGRMQNANPLGPAEDSPQVRDQSSPSSSAARLRKKKSMKSPRASVTPTPRSLESYTSMLLSPTDEERQGEEANKNETSIPEAGDDAGGWSLLGYVGWGSPDEGLKSVTEEEREDESSDGKTSRACMSPQSVGIALAASVRARNRLRARKAVIDEDGTQWL